MSQPPPIYRRDLDLHLVPDRLVRWCWQKSSSNKRSSWRSLAVFLWAWRLNLTLSARWQGVELVSQAEQQAIYDRDPSQLLPEARAINRRRALSLVWWTPFFSVICNYHAPTLDSMADETAITVLWSPVPWWRIDEGDLVMRRRWKHTWWRESWKQREQRKWEQQQAGGSR